MWQWIALAVVAVIILVLVFGSNWRVRPGVSYTQGVNVTGLSQGNFRDLGTAADPSSCQKLCGDSDWCRAYTWTENSATDRTCIGIKNPQTANVTVGGNYTSGERLNGFGPKLMHMFGMEGAGEVKKDPFEGARAPKTGIELFQAASAPQTGLELFQAASAPQTGLELFQATGAPRTGLELFDNSKSMVMPPPAVRLELFTDQNPGFGSRLAPYMRPQTIPTSVLAPGVMTLN